MHYVSENEEKRSFCTDIQSAENHVVGPPGGSCEPALPSNVKVNRLFSSNCVCSPANFIFGPAVTQQWNLGLLSCPRKHFGISKVHVLLKWWFRLFFPESSKWTMFHSFAYICNIFFFLFLFFCISMRSIILMKNDHFGHCGRVGRFLTLSPRANTWPQIYTFGLAYEFNMMANTPPVKILDMLSHKCEIAAKLLTGSVYLIRFSSIHL